MEKLCIFGLCFQLAVVTKPYHHPSHVILMEGVQTLFLRRRLYVWQSVCRCRTAPTVILFLEQQHVNGMLWQACCKSWGLLHVSMQQGCCLGVLFENRPVLYFCNYIFITAHKMHNFWFRIKDTVYFFLLTIIIIMILIFGRSSIIFIFQNFFIFPKLSHVFAAYVFRGRELQKMVTDM